MELSPHKYWSDLKAKMKEGFSELSDEIGQLPMPGAGRFRRISTNFDDNRQLLTKSALAANQNAP
jgi:hypothetical protein